MTAICKYVLQSCDISELRVCFISPFHHPIKCQDALESDALQAGFPSVIFQYQDTVLLWLQGISNSSASLQNMCEREPSLDRMALAFDKEKLYSPVLTNFSSSLEELDLYIWANDGNICPPFEKGRQMKCSNIITVIIIIIICLSHSIENHPHACSQTYFTAKIVCHRYAPHHEKEVSYERSQGWVIGDGTRIPRGVRRNWSEK